MLVQQKKLSFIHQSKLIRKLAVHVRAHVQLNIEQRTTGFELCLLYPAVAATICLTFIETQYSRESIDF